MMQFSPPLLETVVQLCGGRPGEGARDQQGLGAARGQETTVIFVVENLRADANLRRDLSTAARTHAQCRTQTPDYNGNTVRTRPPLYYYRGFPWRDFDFAIKVSD